MNLIIKDMEARTKMENDEKHTNMISELQQQLSIMKGNFTSMQNTKDSDIASLNEKIQKLSAKNYNLECELQ